MSVDRIPALAPPAPDHFPQRRSRLRAIVWSSEEFRAAAEALPMMMQHAGAPERLRRRLRPGEAELCEVACLPEGMRGVARWFEDR